jgi:hypothetical protein
MFCTLLHEQLLYPYLLCVQGSCLLISQGTRTSVSVLFAKMLTISFLTSVVCFVKDGIINIHNHHQLAEENPHDVIHSKHWQFSINV